MEQALDFVIEKKGNETRERSSQIYITIKKLFPSWLEENGFAGLLIKDLTGEIIQAYLGIGLSQNQVYNLLETQSEELKRELLKEKIDPTSLDVLIENVSEKITGMHYPTEFSTDYFREYYQKKLIENRDNFFVKL